MKFNDRTDYKKAFYQRLKELGQEESAEVILEMRYSQVDILYRETVSRIKSEYAARGYSSLQYPDSEMPVLTDDFVLRPIDRIRKSFEISIRERFERVIQEYS